MLGKVSATVSLLSGLVVLLVNAVSIWGVVKMADKALLLQIGLGVVFVGSGIVYLHEKYKQYIQWFHGFRDAQNKQFNQFLEECQRKNDDSIESSKKKIKEYILEDAVVERIYSQLAGEVNDRFKRLETKLQLPEWHSHSDRPN